jgi:hypothetical protein
VATEPEGNLVTFLPNIFVSMHNLQDTTINFLYKAPKLNFRTVILSFHLKLPFAFRTANFRKWEAL